MAVVESVLDLMARTWSSQDEGKGAGRRQQSRFPAQGEATIHWVGEGGDFLQQKVELHDTSRDGVGFLSPRPFPIEQTVWMERSGELSRGTIRHCRNSGERYLVGLVKFPDERRQQERRPCHETGTLEWGLGRSSPVFVRNVSENGVQIEVPYEIRESAVVQLRFGSWQCLGSVCYCKLAGDKYLVGLELVGKPTREPAASDKG